MNKQGDYYRMGLTDSWMGVKGRSHKGGNGWQMMSYRTARSQQYSQDVTQNSQQVSPQKDCEACRHSKL